MIVISFFSLFLHVPTAFANINPISSDPSYAEQFIFYCDPYAHSFIPDRHYVPDEIITYVNPSSVYLCKFSLPNTIISGKKIFTLYKGTPGSAEWVSGDLLRSSGTLFENYPAYIFSPQNEDDFFAVVYNYNTEDEFLQYRGYFENNDPPPEEAVLNEDYYILPWKWGPTPIEEYEPVIIIPGILGSWEKDGEWVLDPIAHTYDNLIDTLLANGYVEDKTLFRFGYDWRNSNITTAQLLSDKVQEIRGSCNCEYVDIISHSMGGLVTAEYIKEADPETDGLDQIFYLGVPFYGSPSAYKTWEGGVVEFGRPAYNLIAGRMFGREARDNGFNSIFEYIQGKPITSIQELLPIYPNYLRTSPTSTYLSYPEGYPRNIFLEELEANISKIYSHRPFPYIFIGDAGATSTIEGFTVQSSTEPPKWEHGEPVVEIFGRGDGTVPYESALYYWGPKEELGGVDHNTLVSASSPYVFELLNNKAPDVVINKIYDLLEVDYGLLIDKLAPSAGDFRVLAETLNALLREQSSHIRTALFVLLYSPVDIQITAPDGKRIGRDINTGALLNEMPEAVYSGPDAEHEFVLILDPLPGTYAVQTVGTGSGSYTIATSYLDTATTSEAFAEGVTTPDHVENQTLILSSTSTTVTIEVDESEPPPEEITPDTCVADMEFAYANGWIKKKGVYNALVKDCLTLKRLLKDETKNKSVRIVRTLNHMNRLAKNKGNTQEAKELITKNTTWFRDALD